MQSLSMFEASRFSSLAAMPVSQFTGDDRQTLSVLQTKALRSAYPVFQALRFLFGDSVDRIECDLPNTWLSEPVGQAYLSIGDQGRMQTSCGDSRVVAMIPTASGACRFRFALVIKVDKDASRTSAGVIESLHLVASS